MYRLPSFLSKGGRDIIPEMLMNDPVKRITIPEIRKEPWFLVNCPPYLQVPWEEYENKNMSWKRRHVICSTVHVNKPEFLELLMQGPFKGMDRSAVLAAVTDEKHTSPVKVTYELKLDEALKMERQNQIRESEIAPTEETPDMGGRGGNGCNASRVVRNQTMNDTSGGRRGA